MKGRPQEPLDESRAPRVRFWRNRREKSQKDVAEFLGLSQPQVARIERGESALEIENARRLAEFLDVAPSDLYRDGAPTLPLRYRVGLALAGAAPAIAGRAERLAAPPRLAQPEDCFFAELVDASADRIGWPPGTFLAVREREALAAPLHRGDRVLVAVYDGPREAGALRHALAGELTPTALGDLLVLTRSSSRDVPPAIVIRASAAAPAMGLAERQAVYLHTDAVDYAPRASDEAEILGRIERAIVP